MSQIEELAKLAAEQDELLKERDATVSTAVWRIRQLETTLAEILGEGCCDSVRPNTLERWRAVLKG